MTAVIGILNKSGLALAADSAVTHSGPNGRKVLNTANKIFTLSKYHPVGVMIYNSASFMDIPWEVLIKEYRRKQGKSKFDSLQEYQNDFVSFIKMSSNLIDKKYIEGSINDIINSICKSIYIEAFGNNEGAEANQETSNILFSKLAELVHTTQPEHRLPDFEGYSLNSFLEELNEEADTKIKSNFRGHPLLGPHLVQIKQIIYNYVVSTNFSGNWSGLVIVGYGDKEIYPSCIPINVAECVNGKLRYYVDEGNKASIGGQSNAFIRPFAQRDVIDTLLTGVDYELNDIYIRSFGRFIEKLSQTITETIRTISPEIAQNLTNSINIDALVKDYSALMRKVKQQKHIKPTMQTVASLSKEDLAEMAESLVYLTYLKRRISSAEESVGGPVDVAVISKGDGFIWIKRKHYFKPELNQNFINNYYNI